MTIKRTSLPAHGADSSSSTDGLGRAKEIDTLLKAVQDQLISFVQKADEELDNHKHSSNAIPQSSLLEYHSPTNLHSLLPLSLPSTGLGPSGVLSALQPILKYSVNTFSPGFLDKLYAATNAPGIASDLILSVLNTNLHVYQVSPALTLIEKTTTKTLASLFGLNGPRAGGITVTGGSASNMTSIVIARNTLYPNTKIHGNSHNGRQLVLFTSSHGHYSIEKAAQACGFGSAAVIPVPVDPVTGCMLPSALEQCIIRAKAQGKTPFYINATAGTTVLGSFDPITSISTIARKHNCWLHIDASWGGPFIFSPTLKARLAGSDLADSIAINPHKMMGVPLTCSFLLAQDLRRFHRANTLPAGYLFHGNEDGDAPNGGGQAVGTNGTQHEHSSEPSSSNHGDDDNWTEPTDLADLTLQCGRRGDSLKLFLSWQYYGSTGYASKIENAHAVASYLASLVTNHPDMVLVSENPPPCLQVCFYFAPEGKSVFGGGDGQIPLAQSQRPLNKAQVQASLAKRNSQVTEFITKTLVERGFMVDFAPALEGREAEGKFFRVVINVQTLLGTVERLFKEVLELGRERRKVLVQEFAKE